MQLDVFVPGNAVDLDIARENTDNQIPRYPATDSYLWRVVKEFGTKAGAFRGDEQFVSSAGAYNELRCSRRSVLHG